MNDTFNMSRLGCLIDRHYAMYRRHYLTALLIPAVLPWLLVGFMLLGSARVEPSWVMALLCCIFAFTAVIVRLTLRAYVMPGVTVAEMTLPVSGAERKLFAWGNSLFWTLIAAVIMWVEIQLASLTGWAPAVHLGMLYRSLSVLGALTVGLLGIHAMILCCYAVFTKHLYIGILLMVLLVMLFERAPLLGITSLGMQLAVSGVLTLALWAVALYRVVRFQFR